MKSQIRIPIKVKSWILIRIRITVKRRKLLRLTTEPWRLLQQVEKAHNIAVEVHHRNVEAHPGIMEAVLHICII
jgi:hypothetical protein